VICWDNIATVDTDEFVSDQPFLQLGEVLECPVLRAILHLDKDLLLPACDANNVGNWNQKNGGEATNRETLDFVVISCR
jgi:hypothetical protein